ncbi:FAD-dependent monooxygenase [Ideonella alba]|uniref:FAD-dependent monooxygenase n=1 Tax=Ideonella alba TaxID=2824118 RepID=A0A940Y9B3_9BURK|nr:FAD-dependent monooxygenase [Ideonella alba]MBQ0930038.1 FAD-dependent monooxygenase [Ideonella alba]
MNAPADRPLRLAIVGAGPAGLTLALLAHQLLPRAQVAVYDARPAERDVAADPRTLALSLGSVQLLERLGAWPAAAAQPITEVRVSQAPPTLSRGPLQAAVRISAQEQAVPQLGAVIRYGALVAPLQQAWQAACAAAPQRAALHLGRPVAAVKPVAGGVEIDAGIAETADLAVIAEGGVFADQSRKALSHDYRQQAWVGQVTLDAGFAPGTAFEHFTREGPLALLPLPAAPGDGAGTRQAALVWCVATDDDPLAPLDDAQRLAVLQHRLPDGAGRALALSPLKRFALGLNAETTLVQGRCVRIGNAAQTLHPVAGQGLNLGLRDAYSLVDALRHAPDLDQALRRTEWARAPDRWATIASTDFLARSFTWQAPGLATLRGLGLAAVQALPPLKAALARQMMFGRR